MGAKNSTQSAGERLERIDQSFFDNKKIGRAKVEKGCNECKLKEEKKVEKKCKQCERQMLFLFIIKIEYLIY